jgi:hypothetical protein
MSIDQPVVVGSPMYPRLTASPVIVRRPVCVRTWTGEHDQYMVVDDVIVLERRLLEPETRSSAQRIEELLDSGFQEIGASGTLWTRAEIISALLTEPDSQHIVSTNFVGREIEPGLVHLTYETGRAGRRTRRSSLWRQSDDGWKLVFHQGTPVSSTDTQVRHH